jgi:hypothetical protein
MKTELSHWWMTDRRAQEYFGPHYALKADVLACIISNGCLADVARKHDVSPQAVTRHAKAVRRIFASTKS